MTADTIKMIINNKAGDDMLYDVLREKLDPRSGEVIEKNPEDNKYWQTAFDAVWKGNIHFIVIESLFRRSYGRYYVMRDGQYISPCFAYTKIDDTLFNIMQSMIDDIESGKYDNKKTLSEKIRSFVESKGLVSYMNDTKWHELFDAVSKKLPETEIQYKLLSDETEPDVYWNYNGDEELGYIMPAQIEWLKIRHTITEYRHRGVLLPPEAEIHDKKDEVTEILERYSIPYGYIEDEQSFIVYGYK